MGKMKEFYATQISNPDMKFIDDAYRYEEWQKEQEIKKEFGTPPDVSDCCGAPLIALDVRGYQMICTKCKNFCKIK